MDLNQILFAVGTPSIIILLLGIIGLGYISKYVRAKKNSLEAGIKNDEIRAYVSLLDGVVLDTVDALCQTTASKLKAASVDGTLTKEEADEIKQEALTMILTTVSTDVIDILSLAFGDVTEYISTKIEAAVYNNNRQNPVG